MLQSNYFGNEDASKQQTTTAEKPPLPISNPVNVQRPRTTSKPTEPVSKYSTSQPIAIKNRQHHRGDDSNDGFEQTPPFAKFGSLPNATDAKQATPSEVSTNLINAISPLSSSPPYSKEYVNQLGSSFKNKSFKVCNHNY